MLGVEAVISFAVEKLGNLLIQQVGLLYGVREKVEWVMRELDMMQAFLKDADAKQRGDELVKVWVNQVVSIADQAADVIDDYMHQIDRRRLLQGSTVGSIKRYALIPSELRARNRLSKEIENIRIKIGEIKIRRDTYGIQNIGEAGARYQEIIDQRIEERRRVYSRTDDGIVVVGFNVYVEEIVAQLLDTNIRRLFVLSILGMGGLGKTTLAKRVFNNSKIKANFPLCIWVTISKDFRLRKVLNDIATSCITDKRELELMDDLVLKEKLHNLLKENTYLIVMDDIWDTNVWNQLRSILPDAENGSRVLITTRDEEATKCADAIINTFKLPLLNHVDSWDLFVRKAFPMKSVCPEHLKDLGDRMVKKCGGLPLALLVLGSLLYMEGEDPLVWKRVADTMDWDRDDCLKKILGLSYNNLPNQHLKSCFLYIGIFREGSDIPVSKLIRLWVAEGFIPRKTGETMEDRARIYFQELVGRSMIQVMRVPDYIDPNRSQTVYRIHDLMRDFCLSETIEGAFLNIDFTNTTDPSPRRLALHNFTNVNLPQKLRSLIAEETVGKLQGLKLLRVLELQSGINNFKSLLKEIELMTHLRYLNLGESYEELIKIPSAIGNLSNLQTLDIRGCHSIKSLPKELGCLPNLRHLFIPKSILCGVSCPPITSSTKLQTLKTIIYDGQWITTSLPMLIDLRHLNIYKSVPNLLNVCLLMTTLSKKTTHIQKLSIDGRISEARLPEINAFPRNLTKLTLSESFLKHDPMPVLEMLPSLVFLKLMNFAYEGKKMVCTTGGFSLLQELRLQNSIVEEWFIEAGALPKLTTLVIDECDRLKMLPEGLQHVTLLKELYLISIRYKFGQRLREGVGEDWYKMQHVPLVHIT